MFIKINELYIREESINQIGPYDLNFQDGYEVGIAINNEKYCLVRFTGPKDMIDREELEAVNTFANKVVQAIIATTGDSVEELRIEGKPVFELLREMLSTFQQNQEQVEDGLTTTEE